MVPLENLASVDKIENIYLFVADSVKEQTTAGEIKSLGVSGRAIASSTYTASSLSSLLSGQYPATHCVWSFDDRLPKRSPILTGPENFGMNAETIWTDLPPSEKPPFRMIGASDDSVGKVSSLDTPFIAVEHHKGGHLPYGYSFAEYESVPQFFQEEQPTIAELPPLYEQSVRSAEDRFLTGIEELKKRGLLQNTLVIYTSDHGEALGEPKNGASIGHGDPISPDLVNVPVVFAGAGLPNTEMDTLLSGIDIIPTIVSALDRKTAQNVDGVDLWTESPTDRLLRSERWVQHDIPVLGQVDRYRATSVWDKDGGIVFQQGSRLERLGLALGNEFVKAPWAYLNRNPRNLQRWFGFVKGYVPRKLRYGNPGFTEREAMNVTEQFHKSPSDDIQEINREQLRKLGYLD